MQYYIIGFKTGEYPVILKDRVFVWGRLYPKDVDVPGDPVGRPRNWEFVRNFPSQGSSPVDSIYSRLMILFGLSFFSWENHKSLSPVVFQGFTLNSRQGYLRSL
jgi:hypothetical protein